MNISKKGRLAIEKEVSSNYEHRYVLSLASYRGLPFVTGSNEPYHNKSELLNIKSKQWEQKADYPKNR